ncbi:MAG: hypothetical protein ONB44_01630 [candidate division KSB1 bacterium]|nr:hypothetical protein [candidate division KSB1 bacterium]MDZ7300821.1 hypothetical protein [candidate division KSB1 bacterium]MDZ7309908.1 hypothetical protein [candidate division KSB1 bacterium]
MIPEPITQESVLEKVRARVGVLDAKAEQAVAQAIAVLTESRQSETSAPTMAEKFVSANVSLAQYEAWTPEERFQYLNNAKKINANWIKKHLQELGAAWLMVVDGEVIAHGASIQHLPQEQEFDALCEKHGKYPFVFFNPRLFMIEEASAWHQTVEPDDAYPTVSVKLQSTRGDLELVADFDTGAMDSYFDFDLLEQYGLLTQGPRDYEDESVHLGQNFRFITKPLRLLVNDESGNSRKIVFFAFCIKNWHSSPFVTINPTRTALVGRSLFLMLAPVVHLDFATRNTKIDFPVVM